MTDSEMTDKARGIARCLTYNDDTPQAAAKHMLLEMAHRIDSRNVRVQKNDFGLPVVINAIGKCRPMKWRERLLYWLAGVVPKV